MNVGDKVRFAHFEKTETIDRIRANGFVHLKGFGKTEWCHPLTLSLIKKYKGSK